MLDRVDQVINGDTGYEDLTEVQQAHVDAALDSYDEDYTMCICGKKIDDCEDAYEHMTSGC